MKTICVFQLLSFLALFSYFSGVTSKGPHEHACDEYPIPTKGKSFICTDEYDPVCGTNGVTYGNKCMLCAQRWKTGEEIGIKKKGECEDEDECSEFPKPTKGRPFTCTDDYQPLCGTNNVTYPNKCMFCAARRETGEDIDVRHKGECEKKENDEKEIDECKIKPDVCHEYPESEQGGPPVCTKEYKPVCGTNGVTYANKCHFCVARRKSGGIIAIKNEGECKKQPDVCCKYPESEKGRPPVCTKEYKPICGTNGVTYGNECLFCVARRQSGGTIEIQNEGECKKEDECSEFPELPKGKPAKCTLEYRPVCGSDGVTYGNKCAFCAAKRQSGSNITISQEGECEQKPDVCREYPESKKGKPPVCSKEYKPVCGTNGVTYGNKCLFCVARRQSGGTIEIQNEGECKKEDECSKYPQSEKGKPAVCTMEYKPICGTDGVTYANKCFFCAAKKESGGILEVQKEGECDKKDECEELPKGKPAKCTLEYRPVCGSDGVTYSNKCAFCAAKRESGSNITISQEGECEQKPDVCREYPESKKGKPPVCSKEYKPVCGTNGVTYGNKCLFCVARRQSGGTIEIQNEGECKKEDECSKYPQSEKGKPAVCTMEYKPICGTDGVTYANKCFFCAAKKESGGILEVQKEGECDKKDECSEFPEPPKGKPAQCTLEYRPVCGSDGVTYGNKCAFCAAKRESGSNITISQEGECEQKPDVCREYPESKKGEPPVCSKEYKPVCGTNGVTYGNKCLFCVARRQSGGAIEIQNEGECKKEQDVCSQYPEPQKGIAPACTREYSPVCGSDGMTYANKCLFCVAKRQSGSNITIKNEGECEQKDECSEFPESPKGKPAACTLEYRPVCGSDGVTYGNKCAFCAAKRQSGSNITISHEGECEQKPDICREYPESEKGKAPVCSKEYKPVCGTNGVTYGNKCLFCVARRQSGGTIEIQNEGECKKEDECSKYPQSEKGKPAVCTMEYRPICGTDGVTYANKCFFCAAKKESGGILEVQKEGECDKKDECEELPKGKPAKCTLEYRPVCGSDGVTYSNKCAFCAAKRESGSNITIRQEGECEQKPDVCREYPESKKGKPPVCSKEYKPVCGTNGVTYGNKCLFCVARRESGGILEVQKEGECDKKDECSEFPELPKGKPAACTLEYRPVCGSDGVTYGNKCAFCAAKRQSGSNITISQEGECEQKPDVCSEYPESAKGRPPVCTKEYKPVCGTNGVMYANKCLFCVARRQLGGAIEIQNEGECKKEDECSEFPELRKGKPAACTQEYRPLCGSDGETYSNKCAFCAAKRQNGSNITISHEGECEQKPNVCREYPESEKGKTPVCSKEYKPVCGTNGVTYGNKCLFCVARRQSGGTIEIQNEGECKQKDECSAYPKPMKNCPEVFAPVCGSNGETYSNKCLFCLARQQSGTNLTVNHKGRCG